MDQLTQQQLQALQALLQSKKSKLDRQLDDAVSATGVVTLDQSTVGRVSRMDAMQQQSMAVSTRAKAQASLRKVIRALNRLDHDDYGYCDKCDEQIQFDRLKVQPEASHCLKCQDELDQV